MSKKLKSKQNKEDRRYYVKVIGDIEGNFDYEHLLPEDMIPDYDPFHGYRVFSKIPYYKALLTKKQAIKIAKILKKEWNVTIWDVLDDKDVTDELIYE